MDKQLIYAAVTRGYTVLVAYQDDSVSTENIERHVTDYMSTLSTEVNTKTNFTSGRYNFYLKIHDGLVYCVAARPDSGVRLPYIMLDELNTRFSQTTLPSRAYNAEEHEFDRDFQSVLRELLFKYNSGESGDQVEMLRGQVHDVKKVMEANINKAMEREGKIDDLLARTEDLENNGVDFSRRATQLRRRMWLKNMKLWMVLGGIGVIVIVLIVLWATKVI